MIIRDLDLAGDSNVEGFTTSNSVFRKNAPSTPQELQTNLRNTTNGASSGRLHSDAQVSLCKSKSWVLDQMLISIRTYLIQVFRKAYVGYVWCMDPCVVHMIVEYDSGMKFGCDYWY